MTKAIIDKFEVGDALSDLECKELYKFFSQLADSLNLMGPHYYLAWFNIYQKSMAVKRYIEARENK